MSALPTVLHPLADNDRIRVCHYRSLDQIDATAIARWQDLADLAVHPNAYLAPDFVLPSLEFLMGDTPFLIAVSERKTDAGWQSIALGVFREMTPSKTVPFRHLQALRSPHGFLGGLLFRRSGHDLAVERFFADFVQCDHGPWRALVVADFPMFQLLSPQQLDALERSGSRWIECGRSQRASIRPSEARPDWPHGLLSSRSAKNYARRARKLATRGEVEHRLRRGDDITDATIESFLALEDTGFRKDAKTSLRSHSNHERFFRTMVTRLRDRDGVFFFELVLAGHVIASTCNLVSGSNGIAFKLGWDPNYAEYRPGIQNELAMVGAMRNELSHLQHTDSGALQGSFMERLWPDSDVHVDGVFTCERMAHWVARAIRTAADWRNHWRGRTG